MPVKGQRKNGVEKKSEEMDRDFYFNFFLRLEEWLRRKTGQVNTGD